jgi:exodeoxyribonuclease VII large subunit
VSQGLFEWEEPEGDPTFGVRELADVVNQVLRRGFRDGVWVRGEIQGLQQRGGHVYFNLTERDDEGQATIAVSLFANTWYRMRGMLSRHRLRLSDGLAVRVHGNLNLYAPSGRLSLVMDGIDVRFTLGALAAQRDDLLARLERDGLLGRNARLPLPVLPMRVGLVSSRGSAAWHDVLHELQASRLGFHVNAVDVRVQGDGAAAEIAAAVRSLARRQVDVTLVVRGGGSRSDLAPFDTEVVARAIASSSVPVLTGLGHEIDRSVADEVAHTASKTPTACAAFVVERVRDTVGRAESAWHGVARHALVRLRAERHRLDSAAHRAAVRTDGALRLGTQRLDHAAERLCTRPLARLRDAERGLDGAAARVHALDPVQVLARGWSITRGPAGEIVRSVHDVGPGQRVTTTVADGTVVSRVEEGGR